MLTPRAWIAAAKQRFVQGLCIEHVLVPASMVGPVQARIAALAGPPDSEIWIIEP